MGGDTHGACPRLNWRRSAARIGSSGGASPRLERAGASYGGVSRSLTRGRGCAAAAGDAAPLRRPHHPVARADCTCGGSSRDASGKGRTDGRTDGRRGGRTYIRTDECIGKRRERRPLRDSRANPRTRTRAVACARVREVERTQVAQLGQRVGQGRPAVRAKLVAAARGAVGNRLRSVARVHSPSQRRARSLATQTRSVASALLPARALPPRRARSPRARVHARAHPRSSRWRSGML
jgi:hypothetical protein